jgi:hypothetical protein
MFDVRRFVHQERKRPAGRLRAGRSELIKQNEPTWLRDEIGKIAGATFNQGPTLLLPAPTARRTFRHCAELRCEAQ